MRHDWDYSENSTDARDGGKLRVGVQTSSVKTSENLLQELYWGMNKSLPQMSRELGVPTETLRHRMVIYKIQRRTPAIHNPYQPEPSAELSYLLGVRYGDMVISRSRRKKEGYFDYIVALAAKDLDFINKFNDFVAKILKKRRNSVQIFQKKYWRITYQSKELFNYLSQDFGTHREVIEAYPTDFLRGFYDSEGMFRYRGKKSNYGDLRLYNSQTWLLNYSKELLEKLGIFARLSREYEFNWKEHKWKMRHLGITRKDDLIKFAELVGFSIDRKQKRLEDWRRCASQ